MSGGPFVEMRPDRSTRAIVATPLLPAARALAPDRPERIAEWISRPPAEAYVEGRARHAIVSLPDGAGAVLLRRVLHGGALGGAWHGRIAGLGRVRRELHVTASLRAAGAPVPVPVFAIARRKGALWEASLATMFEPDARDGRALLASPPEPARLHECVRAAARAIRRFHDAGGRHRDLHLGNLLVREAGASSEAIVVDLDGAKHTRDVPPARRRAELARLARSVTKHDAGGLVDDSVRAVFLSAYCAGDDALERALHASRRPWQRAGRG